MKAYWLGLGISLLVALVLLWLGAPWWAAYISISATYVIVQIVLAGRR